MIAPLRRPVPPAPEAAHYTAQTHGPPSALREPVMSHFIDCLLSNLGLLALTHIACWIARQLWPGTTVGATRLFLALLATELAFDTALTFLVLADAGGNWREYDPRATFPARAAAYAIAGVLALAGAHFMQKRATHRPAPDAPLTIETSPYSKSTLPM
jgi:hypothetical protein